MKKIFVAAFALAFALALSSGCKKESSPAEKEASPADVMAGSTQKPVMSVEDYRKKVEKEITADNAAAELDNLKKEIEADMGGR